MYISISCPYSFYKPIDNLIFIRDREKNQMELNIIVAMDILFLLLTVLNIEIVDSSVQMVSLNLFQISL